LTGHVNNNLGDLIGGHDLIHSIGNPLIYLVSKSRDR
jgi:hypothetical protein